MGRDHILEEGRHILVEEGRRRIQMAVLVYRRKERLRAVVDRGSQEGSMSLRLGEAWVDRWVSEVEEAEGVGRVA